VSGKFIFRSKKIGGSRKVNWWLRNFRPVDRGTGTPKDKDEVNRRDVCECDGEYVFVRVSEFFYFFLAKNKLGKLLDMTHPRHTQAVWVCPRAPWSGSARKKASPGAGSGSAGLGVRPCH
jgi:hypothetical protein